MLIFPKSFFHALPLFFLSIPLLAVHANFGNYDSYDCAEPGIANTPSTQIQDHAADTAAPHEGADSIAGNDSDIADATVQPKDNIPTTMPKTVVTVVTPAPSASPITITKQSQQIWSFLPTMTSCQFWETQLPNAAVASQPPSSLWTSSCKTLYLPTLTPICHTTLHGVGTAPIVVKDCHQVVEFSTAYSIYSNSLVSTVYRVKWDQMKTDHLPTGVITAVYCIDRCAFLQETWKEVAVMSTSTTAYGFDFSREVVGPAALYFAKHNISISSGETRLVTIHDTSTLTQISNTLSITTLPTHKSQADRFNSPEPTPTGTAPTPAVTVSSASTSQRSTTTLFRTLFTTITITVEGEPTKTPMPWNSTSTKRA